MQIDSRQAPGGFREGNYELDQGFTICSSMLGWTWVGKPEVGKRSESNLERRKGLVVEKQWCHAFGQDLTTSGACDSDREASRRRRRKARDGGERRQVACAVHHQHTQHTDWTLLCVIVMCSTRSTSSSSPARQSPDMWPGVCTS